MIRNFFDSFLVEEGKRDYGFLWFDVDGATAGSSGFVELTRKC